MTCPKRFYYRLNKAPDTPNEHMIFGSIVHEAIEKCYNYEDAIVFSEEEWSKRTSTAFTPNLVSKPPKSFKKILSGYYWNIYPRMQELGLIGNEDELEYFFKIPMGDIVLVGKIDRLNRQDNIIFDWKTSGYPPSQESLQAFQFYFYHMCYEMIFKTYPKIYYGYLNGGSILPIDINPKLVYNVQRTIDYAVRIIQEEKFPWNVGYQCGLCSYKSHCFSELRNNEFIN